MASELNTKADLSGHTAIASYRHVSGIRAARRESSFFCVSFFQSERGNSYRQAANFLPFQKTERINKAGSCPAICSQSSHARELMSRKRHELTPHTMCTKVLLHAADHACVFDLWLPSLSTLRADAGRPHTAVCSLTIS